MIADIHKILKQYWGYSSFRTMQEDIILSVLNGKDTLALLPTGGGKSVCFQVPVLASEGMGIVISPLIALMDDQVRNLRRIGIPAISLTSNLSFREIDLALENAVHGKYKFLYLSPERLQSEIVQERFKRMNICLIAVDEAHCISQWGYDFRPPYLKISEIRQMIPHVPVLALTATATPLVVEDIQEKLSFPEKNVFQKSFYRPNLHYNVLHTEKKWTKTLEILQRIEGTAIIYSRNRKHTVEIAKWLSENGFSASFYHAGLDSATRQQRQKDWIENRTRIMVCTNAFGMGIDKPDVRMVIHLELPDSLEAYFQEAGRAGRDGNRSYSVVIAGPSDLADLKSRYLDTFPDLEHIRKCYQALSNYLQLALGAGENQSFSFNFKEFIRQYRLPLLKSYQALKILEKDGYISLNEGFRQGSRLLLKADRTGLYDFQLRNPRIDPFIKVLVRSYGGLETEYTSIDEHLLAERMRTSVDKVTSAFWLLKEHGIIDYIPREEEDRITFILPRQKTDYLSISRENLKDRFRDLQKRVNAVVHYIENDSVCRSTLLLKYFGEEDSSPCGHCDVCRKKKNGGPGESEYKDVSAKLEVILNKPQSLEHILHELNIKEQKAVEILRWLADEGKIKEEEGLWSLRQKKDRKRHK